jgi:hypothetical protein
MARAREIPALRGLTPARRSPQRLGTVLLEPTLLFLFLQPFVAPHCGVGLSRLGSRRSAALLRCAAEAGGGLRTAPLGSAPLPNTSLLRLHRTVARMTQKGLAETGKTFTRAAPCSV